jgi:hypothetical protein
MTYYNKIVKKKQGKEKKSLSRLSLSLNRQGQSAQLKVKRNAQNNATGGATEPPLPYPTGLEFPPLLQLPIFFYFLFFSTIILP